MLSSSSLVPTQGNLRVIFCGLIQLLNKHTNSEYSQSTVANAIKPSLEHIGLIYGSSLAAIENSTTHLSTRNEIDAYFSEPETNVESLLWWKAN
ncbi:2850_t:CDS:2, partial [Rhizophagus irregularis]